VTDYGNFNKIKYCYSGSQGQRFPFPAGYQLKKLPQNLENERKAKRKT